MTNDHGDSGSIASLPSILDALLEAVQVLDPDLRYVYVNRQAAVYARTTPDALVGRTMSECHPGIADTAFYAALRRCLAERRPHVMESELPYPGGAIRHFEHCMQPVPEGVCVLSIDITARKQAEADLRHSQRVEALGRLAAGVAHEFNNLLSVMLICGEEALARPQGPTRADVEGILVTVKRAVAVTSQLLTMSRRQLASHAVTDPGEVVAGLAAMLRPAVGARVRLDFETSPEAGHIAMDPAQLAQIVTNFVLNARDAMPEGGRIAVSVNPAETLELPAELAGRRYVALVVRDEGTGMDEETLGRLFEPFYTTKRDGGGTGLGLSTVLGIVEQSGGTIVVESAPGSGTTFRVYLPRIEDPTHPSSGSGRNAREFPPAGSLLRDPIHGASARAIRAQRAGTRRHIPE